MFGLTISFHNRNNVYISSAGASDGVAPVMYYSCSFTLQRQELKYLRFYFLATASST